MRIGILIPHIFARNDLVGKVIFAPLQLAVDLAEQLSQMGHNVISFTPGEIEIAGQNISLDDTYLQQELNKQQCSLPQLIHKSPLSYVSIARQFQAEITAEAFKYANNAKLDVLHVFMCESEIPLYFADLLDIPVVYTHHDPYNFFRKYRVSFPKLKNLNYVSISDSQRDTAPNDLNFIGTVYNGIKMSRFDFNAHPQDYFAFLGRIIRVKGCHLGISACLNTNNKFKIAGKYYTSTDEDKSYWSNYIEPHLEDNLIEYVGFIESAQKRTDFLKNAKALLFPIEWMEPFGMVLVESLACGTPVIAYPGGAVEEIIEHGNNGFIVSNQQEMQEAIKDIDQIDRHVCRKTVKNQFTVSHMAKGYLKMYNKVCSVR